MTAIGYKEFFTYANTMGKKISDFTKEDCQKVKMLIQRNTRQYAKRQIVFFKALSPAISLHIDDNLAIKTIINDFYASFT
jgi:tRNA A37 N6-isopentenylltransferase MiaA